MNHRLAHRDSLPDRIAEGMQVMRIALDRQAPYLALATAREAARAALLALGQAPLRAGKLELALLREVATATSQRFASRPAERQALASATLALLDRLFSRPALAQGRAIQVRGGQVVGSDERALAGPRAGDPAAAEPGPPVRTGGPSWQ